MKHFTKTLSIILALMMTLSIFIAVPSTVNAEDVVEYPLWVNSEQITSDHLTVQCGDGAATFAPESNTLTLDNAEITKGVPKDWLYTGILSYLEEGLTVVVNGDCSITETGGDGIGSYNSDLIPIGDGNTFVATPYDITVTGDGALTIVESTPVYGYGLYCTGNLVIDGITLNITSASTGVWASSLEMRNTQADIHCTSRFSGIVVNRGDFIYENSTVTAKSDNGVGLLLGSDQFYSALTVTGGELSLSGMLGVQGIVDNSTVTVNGGKLSVEGSKAAFDDSFLADDAKNIILGEGVSVISGSLGGESVVIGSAASDGFTLSGNVTSFVTTEEAGVNYETTVELLQGESVVKTASYDTAAVFDYSFDGVEAGDYTLRVSKQNHVPRDYAVTVSGDTTQDAEIYALGDIDGDGEITNFDYGRVNSCAKGKSSITDAYLFKVADIDEDEEITNFDAGRINSMAKGKSSFWK